MDFFFVVCCYFVLLFVKVENGKFKFVCGGVVELSSSNGKMLCFDVRFKYRFLNFVEDDKKFFVCYFFLFVIFSFFFIFCDLILV